MLTRLFGHLWRSYKATIDTFPSLLCAKKYIALSRIFFNFPRCRILNLKLAIQLPPSIFSTLFTLISRVCALNCGHDPGDISFVSRFFRHI
jgi:hypothetical protein